MRAARAVIVAAAAMALSVVPIRPLRKSNRARRHRLNPGRRSVAERKSWQPEITRTARAIENVRASTDPKWKAHVIADAHALEGKGT